ncbi:hypothetical protein C1645_817041 [Glomus cerebriforme]|uniref:Uncharacterized protein n=1 Tax=Glomus cerebriforme TaxID=658196 RepID=A0A397TE01_9GLOM|nr:hypothetical protein C1645_817041 [Glomus cerebriforme]
MSSSNYGSRNNNQRTPRALQPINMTHNTNNINQNHVSVVLQIRFLNNSNTINLISRITTHQISDNSLENDFFNGTNFDNNNNFESLILPAGSSPTSSFL